MILLWEWIKNIFPLAYLEECKYKIKKMQMARFINTELDSDLDSSDSSDSSDLEAEPENDTAN